ncbi:MAG: radical SAM family heme chaperone HemW [Candidatus Thiodiazotropha taylori]|nr:radical SAM family heme chaperone HemW [Candidatus Thiodiazotropha taylori]MCG8106495.1 radical SAM family heme chaperone HemW [Candidatus Thiodiazotropha taylori]MCG8112597.1 radical SAM family heme chaperone HemW [Candidatus Thiodiazotropha taylori]MCW4278832.1 radical SAM family heme chaperone HemW [Candidatus Thiodiazotropha taylori]MCW4284955.1 radical SAM family heme chaperone HemW [Candidatus Thiodiazotropha taylori]
MISPPLSLYIHIPWCVRKCPYCDFNSHAVKQGLPEQAYVDALLNDLSLDSKLIDGRQLSSIFIGGGTPSLFSSTAVARLLEGIERRFAFAESMEITLEANPGAVEAGSFAGYRQAGVNRLSLGFQSLQTSMLQALGRIHSPQEARDAFAQARKAGFDNINIDLMFGLPEQTLAMAEVDLAAAIELDSEHLSYYQLTLEPNTPFHHAPPAVPDDEQLWQMQQQGMDLLANAGYSHYEVSAYARQGRECRHNMNYWRFGDYLGIGAGAHAKLSLADGGVKRFWKQRHPDAYLAADNTSDFIQGERLLAEEDLVVEFMMNALRLLEGVELNLLESHTGVALEKIEIALQQAVARELMQPVEQRLCPSSLGQRFLNDLISLFSS